MPGFVLSPAILAASIALLFGLIVGSFANVVIHRLPLGESIVFPASRCPKCRTAIRPWQNLPVISWLFLRGRCASCREPISPRYPLVEALHGLGFGLIVWSFGPFPFTLLLLVFFSSLVILALIDWDHQILPDVITLPGILVGIAGSLLPGALVGWREAGLAAGFGYVAFFAGGRGLRAPPRHRGPRPGRLETRGDDGRVPRRPAPDARRSSSRVSPEWSTVWFRPAGFGAKAIRRPRPVEPAPAAANPRDSEPPDRSRRAGDLRRRASRAAEEPVSIGKYKLPFGTFLAASAIFVLFAATPSCSGTPPSSGSDPRAIPAR